jgi:hypothetical protein
MAVHREVYERYQAMIRRGVITVDPSEKDTCCGMARDKDGMCIHRPYHPVYFNLTGWESCERNV